MQELIGHAAVGGTLAYQHIDSLLTHGHILGAQKEHIQPSSVDLSISDDVYRMKGTFLPRPQERIRDLIEHGSLYKTSLEHPLELNCVYLIRLNESLALPDRIFGRTNNKSSTGRVNLQTRLMIDGVSSFDFVPRGYHGDLWLEVIPKSFPIKLRAGERLNQLRFFTEDTILSEREYREAYQQYGLLRSTNQVVLPAPQFTGKQGLTMTIDLSSQDIVGYKCHPTSGVVLEYARRDYDPLAYFEPIPRPRDGQFIMKRDEFYIFVTKELIRVPNEFAVEMMAYDVSKGEFRSHYAGFFDPGFGFGVNGESLGAPAVLEIFTHDNDFVLRDGQPICQMVYERLLEPTSVSYGDPNLSSNYYRQVGPRLSKHFKQL
jgi:dCTP deaminase